MAASGQTGPRLTPEQRDTLLQWLAADYSEKLIRAWCGERGWPVISRQAIYQHREKFRPEIEKRRAERHAAALNSGLALKEERVARLAEHADELEAIKWQPDERGRLWNERAWRDTLGEIAEEMGHRSTGVNVNVGKLSEEELVAEVRQALDPPAAGGDGGVSPPRAADSTEPD